MIEGEIVPRLLLAHILKLDGLSTMPDVMLPPLAGLVSDVAHLAVYGNVESTTGAVQALIDAGHPPERIFTDVLTPAARLLGELWERDEIDFVDVTAGLTRLQQVVRRVSPPNVMHLNGSGHEAPGSVLLSPCPGEQHTFGLMLVEDAFRRAGWSVFGGIAATHKDIRELLKSRSFDIVGFSLSSDRLLDDLASTIEGVRSLQGAASGILVGGRVFSDDRTAFTRVGADGAAGDALEALQLAEGMLRRRTAGTS